MSKDSQSYISEADKLMKEILEENQVFQTEINEKRQRVDELHDKLVKQANGILGFEDKPPSVICATISKGEEVKEQPSSLEIMPEIQRCANLGTYVDPGNTTKILDSITLGSHAIFQTKDLAIVATQ